MAREMRTILVDLGYPEDDRRHGVIETVLEVDVDVDDKSTPAEVAHVIALALLKAQGGEANLARMVARAERGHRARERGR